MFVYIYIFTYIHTYIHTYDVVVVLMHMSHLYTVGWFFLGSVKWCRETSDIQKENG